jgi:hypothetical protein
MELVLNKLTTLQQQLHPYLLAAPAVEFAVLYGSAGISEQFRDVDIAVFVDRAIIPASKEMAWTK